MRKVAVTALEAEPKDASRHLPATWCSRSSGRVTPGGSTTNTLTGARTKRRGTQGAFRKRDSRVYMPSPPLMAGRIEAASGGRSLRGEVGGRSRWPRPCIDLLATKWRALRKSNPHSRRSASGVSRDVGLKNLTTASIAGDRLPTAAQVGRDARSCQTYRTGHLKAYDPGIASPSAGASMPAPHPFPKAPIPQQGSGRDRVLKAES